MSQEHKEQFEQIFQNAVKISFRGATACDGVRSRLLASLSAVEQQAPLGVCEQDLSRFEGALAGAIAQSQDWAVDDALALRVESQLGAQTQTNLLSERSVHALTLAQESTPSAQGRFLRGLRGAVHRSQRQVVAPELCRRRIQAVLGNQRRSVLAQKTQKKALVPFPQRTLWKQGLTAAASVAAGFAVIFATLFGSAEKALANSVRRDHVKCCAASQKAGKRSDRAATPMSETRYGKIPEPPIDSSWSLMASRVCRDEAGKSMIHHLYRRGEETLSLHFMPPASSIDKSVDTDLHEVENGDFPVLAYQKSGWTITVCSHDLKSEELRAVVSQR